MNSPWVEFIKAWIHWGTNPQRDSLYRCVLMKRLHQGLIYWGINPWIHQGMNPSWDESITGCIHQGMNPSRDETTKVSLGMNAPRDQSTGDESTNGWIHQGMNSLMMNPLGIIPARDESIGGWHHKRMRHQWNISLVISPWINPLGDEFHTGMNPYRTNRLWDQTGVVT
jgi:hypothetical protein